MTIKNTIIISAFTSLLVGLPFAHAVDAETFDTLDTNSDGYISTSEAQGTSIESIFVQLDTNKDGYVSKEEYSK